MRRPSDLFSDDFKTTPYWWDGAPRPSAGTGSLPAIADVLVVGSGYTGLHTALQTARGGRETVVVEADVVGYGCSSRNGGQVSTSIKPSFATLSARYGRETAFALRREGIDSLAFIEDFIRNEQIDCEWARVGRFHGAHKPAAYETLARDVANQIPGLEVEAHMVPRSEQHNEIGTDLYHGGVVYPSHGVLQPAKYHAGLLSCVAAAGATVVDRCRVEHIERTRRGFNVKTRQGVIQAQEVVIATNGYTSEVTPWHLRRIIPIGSYIIATEPLTEELAQTVSPKGRIMSDSRKLVFYYRLCASSRRMVFGGRVALSETDPAVSAPRLHASMTKIFPQLKSARISHSWMGFVAYTFDTLAHCGSRDGVYHALGYCGSGVGMASYLGNRLGQQVLGLPGGHTSFSDIKTPTRPLYSGKPWFLAPAIAYYKLRDAINL